MNTQPPLLDSPKAIWDHLEVLINQDERRRRTVWIFVCDQENRGLVVSPIDDLPMEPTPEDCREVVSLFAEVLGAASENGALLVAITRPGPSSVIESDRHWHHAVHEVCAETGVRVLGIHLMTPTTHRAIALDDVM